jgi:hypothetical protein
VIETERLTLRRFVEADRETVARWNEAGAACIGWAFGELGHERPSEWGPLWVHALDR